MKKMRFFSLILALTLIFTLVAPCAASEIPVSRAGGQIFDGDVIQAQLTQGDLEDTYSFTATETKYYKFIFGNQSVESRIGISIADSFINFFFGRIHIEITDQYDLMLADFSVSCGYMGNVYLKLEKGSTYKIKVDANLTGYYKVWVNSFADIGGETWDAATETLSVGQMISSIDAPQDKDWYYFETDDSDSFYEFNLENISASSTMFLELYEYVAGAGEIPLRETFDIYAGSSRSTNKQLKLKPNAKYYMCIYTGSSVGGYQLDVVQTLDAVGDTLQNAYAVNTDTKVTTALDGVGDADVFKFTTKEYEAYYYFNIDNLSVDTYYYIDIYDADGNKLKEDGTYSSNDLSTNIKLLPNTEYYFKVYTSGNGKGNYSFTITDIPDKFANEQSAAGEIQLNQAVSESISGHGDVDFYKFTTANYDAYYYFNVENLSIDTYYYLYVYDADGNELKQKGTYSSYDLSTNVKLSPNTEYFFKVYTGSTGVGNYSVKVTTVKDNYPNTQEEAKKISVGQTVSAALSGDGDVDFFKFTTESANAYYFFNVENLSIDTYYYLYVYDADGNELKQEGAYRSDDLSADVKLSPNTEYFFMVYAGSTGLGNYKVTVTPGYDPESDTKENAKEIKLNGSYTGELSSESDVDWFKLSLAYDSNVRFVFKNESGNSKRFYVYSAINNALVQTSAYNTTEKALILDAGQYYIKVYDNSGFYTVAVGDCGSAHVEGYRYVKATDEADGIKTTYCKSCQSVIKKEAIPRIDNVSLSYTSTIYSGSAKKPSVNVYDIKGNVISSSQYEVKYASGRVNVGTYSVTVNFKGGYAGTKTIKFKITAQPSSKVTAKLSTTTYAYNGKAKTPSVTIKNVAGKTLQKGTDYTVSYPSGRINAGTYKVTITMKGNYSGKKTLTFKINPAKISSYKLSATTYNYNGKAKTPSVTVKNSSGTKLTKNTHYTVSYASGRKNVGTYKVTIKGKGNYTGSKTLTFKINPVKTAVSKLAAGKKRIAVTISKKSTQVTGYQVQYSTAKTFSKATTKTISSYKTTKYTLSGLTSGKTYYVRVRTYKTVNGTKYYSGWSTYKYTKAK